MKSLMALLALVALVALSMLTACGGVLRGDEPTEPSAAPPAGRYAFARSADRLLAIPLDGQAPDPIAVAQVAAEADFALPVERGAAGDPGGGKHHDLLLFNGGRVLGLSGLAGAATGRHGLVQDLSVPGHPVLACGHRAQADDPAVSWVRSRHDNAIVEVDVHFMASTGCIDAAGDSTLSVAMPVAMPVDMPVERPLSMQVSAQTMTATVHARREVRIGLLADGSARGLLQLGTPELVYTAIVDGAARQAAIPPSTGDIGRVTSWKVLARDSQAAFLCGSTDGNPRCALYLFEPLPEPRLTKLSPDDFAGVQMGGISSGRAYLVSQGPVVADQPSIMVAVHEFTLGQPASIRTALTLTPEFRAVSLEQSLLLQVQDTVRYSQYRLVDAASGATWNTDFVTYGSGSSAVYADHRMGCVVAESQPTVAGWSGCKAQAWLTPNLSSGVRDRTVYLVDTAGSITHRWSVAEVAGQAGFIGYETATHLLIGIRRADGTRRIGRAAPAKDSALEWVMEGDVVLYGAVRPRGSVL